MILFIRVLFAELKAMFWAKVSGYYKSIDKIPIYNWDKIESGDYSYLYKGKQRKILPSYFKNIVSDMFFSMEKVDQTYFKNLLKLAQLRSYYITTGNVRFKNQANSLVKKIEDDSKLNDKKHTLNEKVDFIELTFKSIGTIDVNKMSASRFYSLLYRAYDANKQKK